MLRDRSGCVHSDAPWPFEWQTLACKAGAQAKWTAIDPGQVAALQQG